MRSPIIYARDKYGVEFIGIALRNNSVSFLLKKGYVCKRPDEYEFREVIFEETRLLPKVDSKWFRKEQLEIFEPATPGQIKIFEDVHR